MSQLWLPPPPLLGPPTLRGWVQMPAGAGLACSRVAGLCKTYYCYYFGKGNAPTRGNIPKVKKGIEDKEATLPRTV